MRWCLSFLLFTSVVWTCLGADAQSNVITNPTAKDKDKVTPSVSPSMVPPDVPVIRIEGLCSGARSSTKPGTTSKTTSSPGSKAGGSPASNKSAPANRDCQAIVTRAQYDKLSAVVAPKQEPPVTIQLAHFYATQMVYAEKARELGLDKQPRFEE